ncbi:RNA polymerase sigma factor [Gemmatimonadota bacterium]
MTDQRSDRELADLVIREGDEGAFRALYRRHTPAVFRFTLRLVGGDVAEAEDVTQEMWLRAARGLEGFRWRASLKTWLMGIALNRIRELARKKGRAFTEVGGDWELAVGPGDPVEKIDLERAIQLLPPGFRAVLVLHDVEGFTHREIGEQLGITDGTSKSQLHGARKAVRRLLSAGLEMA